ncbi:hypothetical protein C0Z17_07685 [Trinickia caryophylli]|nr:hypothetical protein C0Z17_07685 [Trinickia caryophylli]
MESGLANLRRRIDEVEHEARAVSAVLAVSAVSAVPARSGPAMRFACVLAAIVVLQAGALVAMGVRPESDRTSPAYRTLFRIRPAAAGSRQMPRATIRLVVDDGMAAGRLQALLASLKLQIVGGPGESGIYSLAPLGASGDVDRTIEVLRAAPGVRFAEPASD